MGAVPVRMGEIEFAGDGGVAQGDPPDAGQGEHDLRETPDACEDHGVERRIRIVHHPERACAPARALVVEEFPVSAGGYTRSVNVVNESMPGEPLREPEVPPPHHPPAPGEPPSPILPEPGEPEPIVPDPLPDRPGPMPEPTVPDPIVPDPLPPRPDQPEPDERA